MLNEAGHAVEIKAFYGEDEGKIKSFQPPAVYPEPCNGIIELENGKRYELMHRWYFTKIMVPRLDPSTFIRYNTFDALVREFRPGRMVTVTYSPFTWEGSLPRLITLATEPARVVLDEALPEKLAAWYSQDTNNPPDRIADAGAGAGVSTNIAHITSLIAGSHRTIGLMRSGLDFHVTGYSPVSNAVLTVWLSSKEGNGMRTIDPFSDLCLYAASRNSLNTNSTSAKAAFNDPAYMDTGLRLSRTAAVNEWYSFDVSAYVNSAATNGGIVSFRFQMENDTGLGWKSGDIFQISGYADSARAPELEFD
jgi:hypothetical protein